ncbi:unnamed protein product, partial [Heterosigma akashiwo]
GGRAATPFLLGAGGGRPLPLGVQSPGWGASVLGALGLGGRERARPPGWALCQRALVAWVARSRQGASPRSEHADVQVWSSVGDASRHLESAGLPTSEVGCGKA